MLSQPAVVHLQTSGILPASNPAIAVNGGLKPLTGHTIRVLPQSAGKSLTSGNLAETKPILHTTSSNTNMDVSSFQLLLVISPSTWKVYLLQICFQGAKNVLATHH